uniref:Uncharacterized protein n=1 Tax=Romanomermis culicivorax TaxID=13658 RepID=A0A915K6Q5_ROMCU
MDRNRNNNPIAPPIHVQALQKHLDLGPFIDQLERVFSKPLNESVGGNEDLSSLLSCNSIWKDLPDRKNYLSEFYNFKTVGKRKWLKNLLLEDSDSETDEQVNITDTDIKILLKIHKYRRKFQKRYHNDIMNSQCTYYAAGLLSEEDLHPEHHKYIAEQYGFSGTLDLPSSVQIPPNKKRKASLPVSSTTSTAHKPPTNKRRRESAANAASYSSSSSNHQMTPLLPTNFVTNAVNVENLIERKKDDIFPPIDCQNINTTIFITNKDSMVNETYLAPVVTAVNDPKFKAIYKTIVMEVLPKAYNEKYIAKTYRSIVLKDIATSCANIVTQSNHQLNSMTPAEEMVSAVACVPPGSNAASQASAGACALNQNVKAKKNQKKKNELVALKHVPTPIQSPVKFNKDCV